jgi:hypothetical protein
VCAEVITLCLQQVGGQVLCAVSIVEAQSGAESGSGNTPKSTLGNDAGVRSVLFVVWSQAKYSLSPSSLGIVDSLVEEVVEQQVLEVGVGAVAKRVSLLSSSQHVLTYALVMSFKKTERIMQPPRHMRAISGLFSFHLYSLAACVQVSVRSCLPWDQLAFWISMKP